MLLSSLISSTVDIFSNWSRSFTTKLLVTKASNFSISSRNTPETKLLILMSFNLPIWLAKNTGSVIAKWPHNANHFILKTIVTVKSDHYFVWKLINTIFFIFYAEFAENGGLAFQRIGYYQTKTKTRELRDCSREYCSFLEWGKAEIITRQPKLYWIGSTFGIENFETVVCKWLKYSIDHFSDLHVLIGLVYLLGYFCHAESFLKSTDMYI